MTTEEVREKLAKDPDFVYLKRFEYSLERLLERYPEGCPDRIVAQALLMTEEDVAQRYEKIVRKLRRKMGVRE